MKEWRGTLLQITAIAAIVALVGLSKNADPNVVHFALGTLGGVFGAMVSRARAEASATSALEKVAGGRSLPPIAGAVIGFASAFALGRVFLG